jgi:signal transduction histidine kinase/CheY-like chemotaxis protein
VLLFLASFAAAVPTTDLVIRSWGVHDGLPQSSVVGLAQSPDGYLWMSTFGGLARFDGVHFGGWNAQREPAELGSRLVGVANASQGRLWVARESGGVALLDRGAVVQNYPLDNTQVVWGPWVDHLGRAWIVAGSHAFVASEGGVLQAQELPFHIGLEPGFGYDAQGGLWAMARSGAACLAGCSVLGVVEPPSTELVDRLAASGRPFLLPEDWPSPSECQVPGVRWMFPWNGRKWCVREHTVWSGETTFSLPSGFQAEGTDLYVRAILEDREGALWIGTLGGGLHVVRDQGLKTWGIDHGLEGRTTWAVAEFQGNIWVAQDAGMKWLGAEAPADLASMTGVRALSAHGDSLWMAHGAGLMRYGPSGLERAIEGDFHSVEVDMHGLRAGGVSGLVVRDTTGKERRYIPEELGSLDPIFVRRGPDGSTWAGGAAGQLARIRPDGRVETWGPQDGFPKVQLRDAAFLDGDVWIGSYGAGIWRIRGREVVPVSTMQGLCEAVVSRIVRDPAAKAVWTMGNQGVSRLFLDDLQRAADRSGSVDCDLFRAGEGNWTGGIQASDGTLWFPTINGLIQVDPRAPALERRAPSVVIEEALVAGRPVSSGASLQTEVRDIRFRFTAFGLADREGIRFRHRLVGHDKGWTRGLEGVASYTNLPPGSYTLEVAARGPRSDWSSPTRYTLTFEPRFFETWAGRLAMTLGGVSAFLVAGAAWVAWREQRLVQRARREQRAQEDLERTRRLDAVAQLAGGIAHDFNNLLTAVSLHAEALVPVVGGAGCDDLAAIRLAAERARRLASKLMVRGEHLAAERLDLDQAIARDVQALRRVVPQDVRLESSRGSGAVILVDPSRLEQITLNLVTNAAQAAGRGGRVVVATARARIDATEAQIHGVSPGLYAVVTVHDDGPGVPPELQARIFEPFFTTKPAGTGTGLGLATVRMAAREAGGFVSLRSKPGDTTFTVAFPWVADADRAAPPATPRPPPPRRARVLVVDDEDLVRRPIVRLLRSNGHEVVDFGDPRRAAEVTEPFDLLITDVVMPHVTGAELAATLRARFPGLPTVFITAHTRDVALDRGLDPSVVLLNKPFEPKELLAVVERLARSGSGIS